MKTKLYLTLACVLAVAASNAFAAPKSSPSPSAHASPSPKAAASPAAQKETTARALPFHGKVSAVDQTAKTFTIAGKESSRVFKVTDKTMITKGGTAGTMADIVANEDVRGSYWKAADGSLEAKTVKVGPAEEKAEKTDKKKKSDSSASPSPSAKP